MPVSLPLRLTTLAGVACLGAMSAAAPAQAGLLEFLFGDAFSPAPRYERSEPIDVRVNPRRKAGPSKPVAASPDKKRQLATSIDPVKHPNWHLEDPTLRRGDIVVLKGQVLVFDGSRGPVTRASFTALDKSPLISKGERSRIEKMADTSGTAPVAAPAKPSAALDPARPATNKEASLKATE